jgi:hypothetical protein
MQLSTVYKPDVLTNNGNITILSVKEQSTAVFQLTYKCITTNTLIIGYTFLSHKRGMVILSSR